MLKKKKALIKSFHNKSYIQREITLKKKDKKGPSSLYAKKTF